MSTTLETTVEICHLSIWTDPEISAYAANRRLTADTIREWRLGAFPENPHQLYQLYQKISTEKNSTMIVKKVDSALESPFLRNRFIIPVLDAYGQIDAVMGRTTLSAEDMKTVDFPKYWNTPYKKTRSLFGLNKAIPTVLRTGQIIVAEGNLDVITAHQAGLKNVVAASSAALSKHQLFLAARYANTILLAFDKDEAGERATESIMKKYSALAKKLGVSLLPLKFYGGKDLDEMIVNGGIPW